MMNPNIARLFADGSLDAAFDVGAGLDGPGLCVLGLPDGRVLAGGSFAEVDGVARGNLAVLREDGSVDEEVTADADGAVRTLLLQADGKVLAGGAFTMLAGESRSLARLRQGEGELLEVEASFVPLLAGEVHALGTHGDGQVVVGGAFPADGEGGPARAVRLNNDAGTDSLRVVSATTVVWERGGGCAEVEAVSFEMEAGEAGFGPLGGELMRVPGGWQVDGLALEGEGTLRVRAWMSDSHGGGMEERVAPFKFEPLLEVSLEGEVLTGEAALDFEEVKAGYPETKVLRLRNVGLTPLELGGEPVLAGPNAGQWSAVLAKEVVIEPDPEGDEEDYLPVPVTEEDLVLEPGAVLFCLVTFGPSALGALSGTLAIASDAADSPFSVGLTGQGLPGAGTVDEGFHAAFTRKKPKDPAPEVRALAVTQGNIVAAGDFEKVNGQDHVSWVRLDAGSMTAPGGVSRRGGHGIHAMAQTAEGQWVVGGRFTSLNGAGNSRLARLNADGTTDAGFKMNVTGALKGMDGAVTALALLPDGSLVLGGSFMNVKGKRHQTLAKLSAAGELETAWGTPLTGAPECILPLPDGKLMVGGKFETMGTVVLRDLVRLHANGTLDTAYQVPGPPNAARKGVQAMALDAEGRLLVVREARLLRLLPDGTADGEFVTETGQALGVTLQADGKILVGRSAAPLLVRLEADGAVDGRFSSNVAGRVANLVCLGGNGDIYVAGHLTAVNNVPRHVSRITNNEREAVSVLSIAETSLKWMRGGTLPEAQYVVFDLSEDGGVKWKPLGKGTRLPGGGWELTGLNLPAGGQVRGRARVGDGRGGSAFLDQIGEFSGQNVPDLRLYVNGETLPHLGTWRFPAIVPGGIVSRVLKLRNTGKAPLEGLSVSGENATWSVQYVGESTLPNLVLAEFQEASLNVLFTPKKEGAFSTDLKIVSNVPGVRGGYTVKLEGAGAALPKGQILEATHRMNTSMKLNGWAMANHDVATAFFEYRRATDNVWIRVGETQVSGFGKTTLEYNLSSLLPGTAYSFRVGVYNAVSGSGSPVFATPKTAATPPLGFPG